MERHDRKGAEPLCGDADTGGLDVGQAMQQAAQQAFVRTGSNAGRAVSVSSSGTGGGGAVEVLVGGAALAANRRTNRTMSEKQ